MEFTAEHIANLVKGKIVGDPGTLVSGFSQIEEGKKGHLSFLANPKFLPLLETTEASVIIISEDLLDLDQQYHPTFIVVEDGYLAFQILMNLYQELREKKTGIEQPSFIAEGVEIPEDSYIGAFTYISPKAQIGAGTHIFPHVYIGKNVKIGKECKIDSGVRIYDDCVIGDRCTVHSNTVIGGDGFGYQPTADGFKKIPQLGNVVLEDDVEVGANCTIDRATIGSTIIGKGTKLDNLIQVAHNVKIGNHNVIAAQAGIAGSTTVGNWNMIGGQTGIVGHINIGNQVKIQAQSGIISDVADQEVLYGSPAISASDFRRSYVHFRNFPEIVQRINNLENSKANTNE
ncbi:UDP-3-O-(3-hydroxymyristoyl)glucosamine N-acyltransferase [Elizabethkingia sp. JS20170427COW]|uniref:UDP-3-O-(3-hydroxymyristoyl)glucosamine N-acyltransferase n=1 Tax=Elizabethkingia sp. JS20170427COW TaxID=2583851 RepID=UPI00111005CD|nr:UDP-3-O-(3-hydroxymyristoyl)glucosamine N-acyltransferase [Elizabethkingia sp. JS20170427COW]QCX52293.1 UDP-3-O-(3-hydroxymyristoyl)glucosamine N-acyltransferase [Elizabethkingia sp. JS20170427COW]